ncbi:MAG TPA: (2Fe-2S)-binding protein [Gemmatimonadales bacterium]|nr:(2Fe-2S)-binding protein [Gemmatimonadales bacterium]
MNLTLTVNGESRRVDPADSATLLGVLRDELGLTGTHYGCGHGVCGACIVLLDGEPAPACKVPALQAAGKAILTIEGLARGETLSPIQQAFLEADAMQCGYCTPGMIMSATALLARIPHPTDDEIRAALASHLCRCGVYGRVIDAIKAAAR